MAACLKMFSEKAMFDFRGGIDHWGNGRQSCGECVCVAVLLSLIGSDNAIIANHWETNTAGAPLRLGDTTFLCGGRGRGREKGEGETSSFSVCLSLCNYHLMFFSHLETSVSRLVLSFLSKEEMYHSLK